MRRRRIARRDERGLAVVLVGVSLMVLMTLTALVVDHGFLRNDRRADQKVADAAATAGAWVLDEEDGRTACQAALATLIENTPGVSSFTGADCSTFPQVCNPATPVANAVGTAGDYRVRIVHPVPDSHAFMARASALGAPSSAVVSQDGSPCQRIGVSVELTRAASFGSLLGAGDQTTSVHAVAKAGTPTPGNPPINLLILERYACHAVVVEGQAKLTLGAIIAADGVSKLPGILAVDSSAVNPDGTWGNNCGTSASPNVGTLHVQGSNALVQADGPPGCPTELVAGTGQGCGYLELLAAGVPGPASPLYCLNKAYWPACTSTGIVRPHPVRMPERRTREPFDHRFDCRSFTEYEAEPWFTGHPIAGCDSASLAAVDADFVTELEAFVTASAVPPGFTTYTGPCTVESTAIDVDEGNVVVDCNPFVVKNTITFKGGNVIFNGMVDVTSGNGNLIINACGKEGVNTCNPAHPLTWSGTRDSDGRWVTADNFDEKQYSSDAAWVYFRNGGIKKDAGAKIHIYDSALFFPPSASIPCGTSCTPTNVMGLTGGSGSLVWHAPRSGPFDVLSMWSESPLLHDMGGQANLDMEGVYFAPDARLVFRGTGAQAQVAAQLVTERLTVTGSGELLVIPNIARSVQDPQPFRSAIIR